MKSFILDSSARTSEVAIVLGWTVFAGFVSGFAIPDRWTDSDWCNLVTGCGVGFGIGMLHVAAESLDFIRLRIDATSTTPWRRSHRDSAQELFKNFSQMFVFNSFVPFFFVRVLTAQSGRIGMLTAILTLFCVGWCLCAFCPRIARRINAGAALTAVSQCVPLIHISLGLWACERFGQVQPSLKVALHGRHMEVTSMSELGGFLVTMIMGGVLISAAGLFGTWFYSTVNLPQRGSS